MLPIRRNMLYNKILWDMVRSVGDGSANVVVVSVAKEVDKLAPGFLSSAEKDRFRDFPNRGLVI